MAEREGFEPPVRFPVLQFSRLAPSTTRPPLQTSTTVLLQSPIFSEVLSDIPFVFNRLHPVNLAVHGFSRPEPSTTRPPLRILQFLLQCSIVRGAGSHTLFRSVGIHQYL